MRIHQGELAGCRQQGEEQGRKTVRQRPVFCKKKREAQQQVRIKGGQYNSAANVFLIHTRIGRRPESAEISENKDDGYAEKRMGQNLKILLLDHCFE